MSRNPEKGHSALRRGRTSLPHQAYNITVVTSDRQPWFLDYNIAFKASPSFQKQTLLGSTMLAWVLMPDHAHWLIQLGERDTLERVVSRLKAASARTANQALGRQGPLWQQSFHDHAMRSDEDLKTAARYIVANPVRAGLVQRTGQYPFWNAIWLYRL
jgi:putative transposase